MYTVIESYGYFQYFHTYTFCLKDCELPAKCTFRLKTTHQITKNMKYPIQDNVTPEIPISSAEKKPEKNTMKS